MSEEQTNGIFLILCRSFWLTRIFSVLSRGRMAGMIFLALVFLSFLPLPCFWAALRDDTLYLEQRNQGAGLMEHPAFWALFTGGPALLVLTLLLFKRMAFITDKFCSEKAIDYVPECREKILDLLACRTKKLKLIFGTMMLLGIYAVVANYQNTRMPTSVFGQDVWDSIHHPFGFWVAKGFLAVQWVYVLPLAIYAGVSASTSILLLVSHITSKATIKIKPFEPDGCGGYRILGQAMLSVIYLNVPFALFIAADIFTHKTFYTTLVLAALLLISILAFEIFAPFVRLHRLLSAGKSQRLQELSSLISLGEASLGPVSLSLPRLDSPALLAVLATVELYKQTQKMRTWPYLPSDRIKWLTPLSPLILGVLKKVIT
jgi:hypothetical protein